MHEKNIFLDKPMITSSHFNRLHRSLRQSFCMQTSVLKIRQSNIVCQKQQFFSVLT